MAAAYGLVMIVKYFYPGEILQQCLASLSISVVKASIMRVKGPMLRSWLGKKKCIILHKLHMSSFSFQDGVPNLFLSKYVQMVILQALDIISECRVQ